MRLRFKRDSLDAEIRGYGTDLLRAHRQCIRRIRWTLEPEAEWWTLVALQAAATGAAVAVGRYRRIADKAMQRGTLLKLVSTDPVLDVSTSLGESRTMRAAYRVVTWAYASELAAELWPERHEHETEIAERVLGIENRQERAVAWSDASSSERTEFVANAIANAADLRLPAQDPWREAWRECYARGREIAGERLKDLASRSVLELQPT